MNYDYNHDAIIIRLRHTDEAVDQRVEFSVSGALLAVYGTDGVLAYIKRTWPVWFTKPEKKDG